LRHAAAFEDRIEQRHELARERQLARFGLPTRGEDQNPSGARWNLEQRRVAAIEAGQRVRVRELVSVQTRIAPKMDFGEIAEPWVGKRGEDWMAEIDLTKHSVAWRSHFLDLKLLLLQQAAQGRLQGGRIDNHQRAFAARHLGAYGLGRSVRQRGRD